MNETLNITAAHYEQDDLLASITKAIARAGKSAESISVQDLAPADEFHIGGRPATTHLAQSLDLAIGDQVLDIGCGLGGTARYLASQFGASVQGIDLTRQYVEAGNTLNQWVGLDGQISLHHGNALKLPFEGSSFDHAVMLHVGMNIANKKTLFEQIIQCLKPGGRFVLYDVMMLDKHQLHFPMPWASGPDTSFVESPDTYQTRLGEAGFTLISTESRAEFAQEFFQKMKAAMSADGGPSPIGLQLVMGPEAPLKLANLAAAVMANRLAPVQIVSAKP